MYDPRLVSHAMHDDDDEEKDASDSAKKGDDDQFMLKFLKTRTILVSGEIDKALAEKVVSRLLLLESMGDEPIKVFIDSPGGDADAGFAIFDMMRFVKPPVYTIGMGLVASAASIIQIAAPKERRVGLPNSHYLIHQPLSGMRGVASEIEIHAREMDKIKKRINELLAKECGQDLKRVEQDTDRDFWMTAEEAVKYGLISKVVTKREEI